MRTNTRTSVATTGTTAINERKYGERGLFEKWIDTLVEPFISPDGSSCLYAA